ncbi:MAG: type II toxin-antitoxin system Phd/YefM family antitoxin [Deltaproteobacteria bacterium]|nr:type II toxin-antitoxin system Phd/YefM family antitoxin [Deltaproteobacteria bacterium]
MKTAGIREVKNQLSKYLRLVADGEIVLVTDRGNVVAQLAPPPVFSAQAAETDLEALQRLARLGKVRLARPGVKFVLPRFPPLKAPVDLAKALRDVRRDKI